MVRTKKSKKWWYILALAIIALGSVSYLYVFRTTSKITKQSPPHSTIKSLPSKPIPNGGVKRPTTTSSVVQGTSTNITSPPASTSPSQWTQSQSGLVTVQQPINNSTVAPNFTLSGLSSVGNVSYTLIDNTVGVISQGTLNVVNGKFSGSINFKKYGNSGRLDVYNTDPNGKQINEVQLNLNF